jgi:hypothetical protein
VRRQGKNDLRGDLRDYQKPFWLMRRTRRQAVHKTISVSDEEFRPLRI